MAKALITVRTHNGRPWIIRGEYEFVDGYHSVTNEDGLFRWEDEDVGSDVYLELDHIGFRPTRCAVASATSG